MTNRAYLCATNNNGIYPSFQDKAYDLQVQTIAADVYCIPLLWMAIFRPADMVKATFTVDGEPYPAQVPITLRARALVQLREASPYLNTLFSAEGPLDGYMELFAKAIDDAAGDYITIELEEIAALVGDESYDQFKACLAAIGVDTSDSAKKRFVGISTVRVGSPFPPARMIVDDLKPSSEDDFPAYCRIVGTSMYRDVPWEESATPKPPSSGGGAASAARLPNDPRKQPISDLQIAGIVILIALAGIIGMGVTSQPYPLYLAGIIGFVAVKVIAGLNKCR